MLGFPLSSKLVSMTLPKELIEKIVSVSDYNDCFSLLFVNKELSEIAESKIREIVIPLFKKSIETKSAGFFQLTSKTIEAVCPNYVSRLDEIEKNMKSLSLKQIKEQLDSLTEKYDVHIATIGEYDLPEMAKIGTQFAKFNYKINGGEIQSWGELPSMAIPEAKNYFPLKMMGNEKRVCFPLYGRLIELIRDFSLDQMNNTHRIYYPQSIYSPSSDASGPMDKWKETMLEKLLKKKAQQG